MPSDAPQDLVPPGQRIVVFDGDCGLCSASVRFILRHDTRSVFRFAPARSDAGRRLCARHGIDADRPDTVVVVGEGRAHLRGDAVLEILRGLGGWWRTFLVLRIMPRPLRDAVYRWIARNRHRWSGRTGNCPVPTPELRSRFLDRAP